MNYYENPRSVASIAGHPIHQMLMPFPMVCFIGALATDITYWQTAQMIWTNFSAWLLAFGMAFGVLAFLALLVDVIGSRHVREFKLTWVHLVAFFVTLVVALINNFVHSRDAWTSVVPTGLILSVVTTILVLFTAWTGWSMVFRHRIGVSNHAF